MPSYRELLQQVKSEIDEVDVTQARELLDAPERPLVVDVRELDEWTEGRIPGAIHIPRGNLESRIEQAAPDHAQPIFLYCAAGNRSAFAAKSLEELGYENVVSLAGGYTDWKRSGLPTELPRTLDGEKRAALQPPRPHPRGRRRGPAQAARLARAAARRGRPRLAVRALPRGGGRRTARDRRRRPRRRVEPAAPGAALDRAPRRLEGGVGQARRSRSSTPTSRSCRTSSGSRPRTSSGSSPTAGT